MTKKRIIFFSRDLRIGGMEKALVLLLNRLSNLDCYIITLVLERKEGSLLSELNKNIIVKEYRLSGIKNVFFRKLSNYVHRLLWFVKNYNRYSFSCNYATYSTICSRLAEIASDNSALYVHSDYYNYFSGDVAKIKSFFDMQGIKKLKHIIFVSKESEVNLKNIYPELLNKFCVISNLIDLKNILSESEKKVEERFCDKNINLLFVGRLDNTSKNIDLLLESFEKAYCENSQLRLYILGSGPYQENIKKQIKERKIKGIYLLGEKENPYPYIKMCDGMILTSKYEGYPIVYTEALVLNKKFITTVPVSDDYIDVKKYFTITQQNPKDISKAILKLNKKEIKYNIDFEFVNGNRLRRIIEFINRKSGKNDY